MIIKKAHLFSIEIPLTVPYQIAYDTISSTTNHFLQLVTGHGLAGIGCAAPAQEVTGESPSASLEALKKVVRQLEGMDVEEALQKAPEWRLEWLQRCPSAACALDMALADLSASASEAPLVQWLGASPDHVKPVTTSITIGISSLDDTMRRAERLIGEGFTFLKIKGGHDVVLDLKRLVKLRETYGSHIQLALDANQGYTLKDVDRFEKGARDLGLKYLEQPTPKRDLALLGQAASATSIPVMADEAVQTVDDTCRIGDLYSVRLINIKLQKMGGLQAAHAIDQASQEAQMHTMLGCMDESALSIAAALHFGASHPNVHFYDLDGHFDLAQDPFEHLVHCETGNLTMPISEGLTGGHLPDLKAFRVLVEEE